MSIDMKKFARIEAEYGTVAAARKERPILFSTPMVQAILKGRKTQTRRAVDPRLAHSVNDCPYGKIGDRLWVRETWAIRMYGAGNYKEVVYRADLPDGVGDGFWRPSIFLPKAHCRLWLEVVSVRTERLNEISELDAIAEGIEEVDEVLGTKYYRNYSKGFGDWMEPKDSYRTLWESINGPGSWEANPWVWVIEFKKIWRRHEH